MVRNAVGDRQGDPAHSVMAETSPQAVYWLDADDRIVDVSADWGNFAEANGASSLQLEKIRGLPLRNFIVGDTTRAWVFAMLSLARLRREPVENPYRCDSPDERRFMSMRVVPLDNNGVRVEHYLLRTEPAPARVPFHHVSPASSRYRVRCSICNKIMVGGKWRDPFTIDLEQGGRQVASLAVIYGVCPRCRASSPSRLATDAIAGSGNN